MRFTRLAPLSILRIPAVGRDVKLRNTGSRGIPRKPGKEENRGPSQEKGQRRGILTGNGFHSWRIVHTKSWFKISYRYISWELNNFAIIIFERNVSLFIKNYLYTRIGFDELKNYLPFVNFEGKIDPEIKI